MVLWTYGLSQWAIHQSTMAMPYQTSTKIAAQTKQFEGIEMMGPRGLLKRISVMMKLEGLKMVTIGPSPQLLQIVDSGLQSSSMTDKASPL